MAHIFAIQTFSEHFDRRLLFRKQCEIGRALYKQANFRYSDKEKLACCCGRAVQRGQGGKRRKNRGDETMKKLFPPSGKALALTLLAGCSADEPASGGTACGHARAHPSNT